ncbi:unnamed protein product [Lepidochelys kempii]
MSAGSWQKVTVLTDIILAKVYNGDLALGVEGKLHLVTSLRKTLSQAAGPVVACQRAALDCQLGFLSEKPQVFAREKQRLLHARTTKPECPAALPASLFTLCLAHHIREGVAHRQ